MRSQRLLKVSILCAALAFLPAYAGEAGTATGVEPEIEKILRGMSDYLESLQRFSVRSEQTSDEILVSSGQRIQLGSTVKVSVRRPDRLRASTQGDLRDQELFYDGKTLTLLNKNPSLYATIEAPPRIDAAMNLALESLGLVAPLLDFVHANAAEMLLENVKSGLYAGLHKVRGVECHHLAFSQDDIDWQIWIENSQTPVPRKFVITDKEQEGAPQFTALLLEWSFSPDLEDELFAFTPPQNAERIEFIPLETAEAKEN